MDLLIPLASLLSSLVALVLAVQSRTKARKALDGTATAGVSARLLTLEHIAKQAAGAGEQLGKTPQEKLQHAMSAARALDMADNQRRDFTDAELRIAIEAHLGRQE